MAVHVSLDEVNLNAVNVSAPDFDIWQHIVSDWATIQLQKLVDIPEIPVAQQCKHTIAQDGPTLPFKINGDTKEESSFTWKLLAHSWTYIGTICMVFIAFKGVYCFKRFWCGPATQRHWPYFPVLLQHIYRSGSTVEKPIRPCKNHDLHIEWETKRLESHCNEPALSKVVPSAISLASIPKSMEPS